MNQDNSDKVSNRDNGIERWETLKIMTADTKESKEGTEVRVSLVVSQPIFKDGNVGYPKASLVIMRDRAVFRIPFFKGSADEAEFICDMMDDALDKWDEGGRDEFDRMIRNHRDMLEETREARGNGDSRVGNGLSKFSDVPKRERRRKKRESEDA